VCEHLAEGHRRPQQPGNDLDALVTAEFDLEDTEAALTSDADPATMKSVVLVSRG
jgi:hypothetical protein